MKELKEELVTLLAETLAGFARNEIRIEAEEAAFAVVRVGYVEMLPVVAPEIDFVLVEDIAVGKALVGPPVERHGDGFPPGFI